MFDPGLSILSGAPKLARSVGADVRLESPRGLVSLARDHGRSHPTDDSDRFVSVKSSFPGTSRMFGALESRIPNTKAETGIGKTVRTRESLKETVSNDRRER